MGLGFGVGVAVGVGDAVTVRVGDGMAVSVGVGVTVGVGDGATVGVGDGATVGVGDGVAVGVGDGVAVGVRVLTGAGVGESPVWLRASQPAAQCRRTANRHYIPTAELQTSSIVTKHLPRPERNFAVSPACRRWTSTGGAEL